MDKKISLFELSKELKLVLDEYSSNIIQDMKKVTKETAEELKKDTKRDAPKKTKEYSKHISCKLTNENAKSITYTWYVKDPEYRLSHLIIKSHKMPHGGNSKSNDFLEKDEQKAVENYKKKIRKVIEG